MYTTTTITLLLLTIACCLNVAKGQDCSQDVIKYFTCLQNVREQKKVDMQAKKALIDACYTSNGCTLAQKNTTAPGFPKNFGANITDEQKQCLEDQFEQKANAKLETCIGHSIPEWYTAAMSTVKQQWKESAQNGEAGIEGSSGFGGFPTCPTSEARTLAQTCIKNIATVQPDVSERCTAQQTCEQESFTDVCKSVIDQFRNESCKCFGGDGSNSNSNSNSNSASDEKRGQGGKNFGGSVGNHRNWGKNERRPGRKAGFNQQGGNRRGFNQQVGGQFGNNRNGFQQHNGKNFTEIQEIFKTCGVNFTTFSRGPGATSDFAPRNRQSRHAGFGHGGGHHGGFKNPLCECFNAQ